LIAFPHVTASGLVLWLQSGDARVFTAQIEEDKTII
jgi:hypothetical protein